MVRISDSGLFVLLFYLAKLKIGNLVLVFPFAFPGTCYQESRNHRYRQLTTQPPKFMFACLFQKIQVRTI